MRKLAELQAKYREAYAHEETYRTKLRAKYGSGGGYSTYASRAEAHHLAVLRRKVDRVRQSILRWLEDHCAWNFQSGVSCHWLCAQLTEDQAKDPRPLLPAEAAAYGMPHEPFTPEPRILADANVA